MIEGFSELSEPDFALIRFRQLIREQFQAGIDRTQEIEIKRFAVKKMLDIDQNRPATPLPKQPGTGFESSITKPVQPLPDQPVGRAQSSQQYSIWFTERVMRFQTAAGNLTQHATDLQPACGSANDVGIAGIMPLIGRSKASNLPQQTDTH